MLQRVLFVWSPERNEQIQKDLRGLGELMTELQDCGIRMQVIEGRIPEWLVDIRDSLVITDIPEVAGEAAAVGAVVIAYIPEGSDRRIPEAELVLEGFDEADVALLEQTWCHGRGLPYRVATGERIYLQELTEQDLPELYRIYHLPEVTGFLQEMTDSLEAEQERLAAYRTAYRFYGCGLWGIYLREDDRLIGVCGVEVKEGPELGYVLDPLYCGVGYATEAATIAMRYAVSQGYETIWARIHPDNVASLCVAERLGMKRDSERENDEYQYYKWNGGVAV